MDKYYNLYFTSGLLPVKKKEHLFRAVEDRFSFHLFNPYGVEDLVLCAKMRPVQLRTGWKPK
jgi:hypothetical protein